MLSRAPLATIVPQPSCNVLQYILLFKDTRWCSLYFMSILLIFTLTSGESFHAQSPVKLHTTLYYGVSIRIGSGKCYCLLHLNCSCACAYITLCCISDFILISTGLVVRRRAQKVQRRFTKSPYYLLIK